MSAYCNGNLYFMYRCKKCEGHNWRPVIGESATVCDFCGESFSGFDIASEYNVKNEKDAKFSERVRLLSHLSSTDFLYIYDDFAVLRFKDFEAARVFFNLTLSREPLFQDLTAYQRQKDVCLVYKAG